MDYPNAEARESFARSLLASYFESLTDAENLSANVRKALTERDLHGLIWELNVFLEYLPDNYFTKKSGNETFYLETFQTLLLASGLEYRVGGPGPLGRSNLIVKHEGRSWMIELVVNHGLRGDRRLAEEALDRVLSRGSQGADNVIVALVVRESARAVTAWASRNGSGEIASAGPRGDRPQGEAGRAKRRPAPKMPAPT
jgi:hypothetical protein